MTFVNDDDMMRTNKGSKNYTPIVSVLMCPVSLFLQTCCCIGFIPSMLSISIPSHENLRGKLSLQKRASTVPILVNLMATNKSC